MTLYYSSWPLKAIRELMGDKQLYSKHPLYFKAAESYGDHHLISVFGEKNGWQVSFNIYHMAHSNLRSVKKKIFLRHLRIEEV